MIKPGDVIVVTNPRNEIGPWKNFKGTLAVATVLHRTGNRESQYFNIIGQIPHDWDRQEFCLQLPIDMTELEIIGRIDA